MFSVAQEARARQAYEGLVPSAISDETPYRASIRRDVLRVESSLPGPSYSSSKKNSQRGSVTSFSSRSRRRMLEQVASIRAHPYAFCTLTYPDDFPRDPARWRRDIKVMIQRLTYAYPGIGYVWRREHQVRKSGRNAGQLAPHFHVLVYGEVGNLYQFRMWLREAWHEVVGTPDDRHLYAGTQADEIKNHRHAGRYAAKYAAKVSEQVEQAENAAGGSLGRFWGYGGQLDDWASHEIEMTREEVIELRRMVRGWLRARGAHRYARRLARLPLYCGFAVLGLGDESQHSANGPPLPTILRMISATREMARSCPTMCGLNSRRAARVSAG